VREPTVSVVVPLYNHSRYIGAALESVLTQTSAADEIVLIDDGSTDNGIARAESVLKGHPNARVYRQPNCGAHSTLNTLVRISRGEYVAVLNSDDVFMPTKLARCRKIISEQPGTGLVCGAIELFDGDGQEVTGGPEVDWLDRARAFYNETGLRQLALLNENSVATTSNMVFSRSLWRSSCGFQNLRYCHDIDFLMTAFAYTTVVIDDAHPHIRYRTHATNTIKENVQNVRLELAAVIASTLYTSGQQLLGVDVSSKAIGGFRDFMRNKSCGDLIALFQTLCPGFASRAQFYAFVLAAERREMFLELG
jgi:glycosyltransferase involved in cell wall biosynthesis